MSILRSLEPWPLLAVCLALVPGARAADDLAAQRARVASERAAVEAKARSAEAACASEFAVSACVKAARAERRAAVQQLDRQRALIDDAQRKQRAAERLSRLRERQDAAARASEEPPVDIKTRTPHPGAPERSAGEVAAEQVRRAAQATKAASAVAGGEAMAAERAAAVAQRERDAAAHRDFVEKRNRARAEKKPPAKPLPLPASAPG
jgi:hypothetical protein